MRTHRVGTLTLGIMLITSGALFLLNSFIQNISYEFIIKLWPVIFILLGFEVLYGNFKTDNTNKLLYDKMAFFLIIILSFFAMGMAAAELFINYAYINMI